MIPARRWRRAVIGSVVGADLLVVLLVGARLPGAVLLVLPLLVVASVWGLLRPGGWGGFALVGSQVFALGTSGTVPEGVTDWALAAVAAGAVLLTHVGLALLAVWPPGAALPVATARRWATQAGTLALVGAGAAGLGVVGSATPTAWAPWVAGVALLAVAATAAVVGVAARRRR